MNSDLRPEIRPMTPNDVDAAIHLWTTAYALHCSNQSFPSRWRHRSPELEGFIQGHVEAGRAWAAVHRENLVGYLAYDSFPFHGEPSAFCPFGGHAAAADCEVAAYQGLYQRAAEAWVREGILNHLWTIAVQDAPLQQVLFDLGFGSYVVDCFRRSGQGPSASPEGPRIRRAGVEDLASLGGLVAASKAYYAASPLFLNREDFSNEALLELVTTGNVYLASIDGTDVGFINLSVGQRNNVIDMSEAGTGMIDELGLFVVPDQRGTGVGKALVRQAFSFCNERGIERIHVDFESANLLANVFWRKHFTPMLLSLKRTVPRDMGPEPSRT